MGSENWDDTPRLSRATSRRQTAPAEEEAQPPCVTARWLCRGTARHRASRPRCFAFPLDPSGRAGGGSGRLSA